MEDTDRRFMAHESLCRPSYADEFPTLSCPIQITKSRLDTPVCSLRELLRKGNPSYLQSWGLRGNKSPMGLTV